MPNIKLTERIIEALEPEPKQVIYWDTALPGFGLSISRGGTKSYIAQGYVGERSRRVTIGRADLWSLKDARARGAELLGAMARGVDPKAKPPVATFGAAFGEWKEIKEPKASESTRHLYHSLWRNYLREWSAKDMASTTSRDLIKLHADIMQKVASKGRGTGGGATANQAVTLLRTLWNLAADLDAELPSRTPFRVMARQNIWAPEPPRTDVIDLAEMRALWRVLSEKPNDPASACSRLILVTGRRFSEAAKLTWDEVRLGNAPTIDLPAARIKTRVRLHLPLPSVALDILRPMEQLGSEYCFPSLSKPRTPVSTVERTLGKALGRKAGPHLLRRSWATLAATAIPEAARKRLLHHTGGSVTDVHYTHLSEDELRRAANKVADLISD